MGWFSIRWSDSPLLLNKRDHLIVLLDQAEELVSYYRGGYSTQFFSAQEFHAALAESIRLYKQGDETQLEKIYFWFAPTCCWDDFTGAEGMDIANKIFELTDNMLRK